MAAVPRTVFPPRSSRPKSRAPCKASAHPSSLPSDPFHGHEDTARLCARYINYLFRCSEFPPNVNHPQTKLPVFIAYALHRTKLDSSVTFAAMVLLTRLKSRYPGAKGSSGHRLFISAFMVASKVMCDDTYSNKSWAIVAQSLFSLREINQMEREISLYLNWELVVDSPILDNFSKMLKRDFATDDYGSVARYPLEMISKRPQDYGVSSPSATASSCMPQTTQLPQRGSTSPMDCSPDYQIPTSPPEASHSNGTTPESSPSPETPVCGDYSMNVVVDREDDCVLHLHPNLPQQHPLGKRMFAEAVPSGW